MRLYGWMGEQGRAAAVCLQNFSDRVESGLAGNRDAWKLSWTCDWATRKAPCENVLHIPIINHRQAIILIRLLVSINIIISSHRPVHPF